MKPMLAAICEDLSKLRFPVLATPKIDGIRAIVKDKTLLSRSLKPIPNKYVQRILGHSHFNGLDGELDLKRKSVLSYKIDGTKPPTFQQVSSAFMSEYGEPDFVYRVFDAVLSSGYNDRIEWLRGQEESHRNAGHLRFLDFLFPIEIADRAALDIYVNYCLLEGHEGVMIRSPNGPYKHGRSTFKEQYLVKIKPLEDDEATIVGFEEAMENTNEATTNALGRTERSHHKSGMVPKNTLGALICKSDLWKETFNIGTGIGFDDELKWRIWHDRPAYLGRIVKYRYQAIGSLDRPRQPSFLGFRDERDLALPET